MGTVSEVIDDCHVLMDRGHRVSSQKRVLFWGNKELICPGLGWVFGPVQDGSVVQTFQTQF